MRKQAESKGWAKERAQIGEKVVAESAKKVAEETSENAVIAARIKRKLLLRLEKEIDKLPESIGSETSTSGVEWGKNDQGNKVRKEVIKVNKLKDLTGAYKDLTDDMPKDKENPALERLDQMLAEVKKIALDS